MPAYFASREKFDGYSNCSHENGLTGFCRFSKGAFYRKSPISMGRKDRLKPGKLLNLI